MKAGKTRKFYFSISPQKWDCWFRAGILTLGLIRSFVKYFQKFLNFTIQHMNYARNQFLDEPVGNIFIKKFRWHWFCVPLCFPCSAPKSSSRTRRPRCRYRRRWGTLCIPTATRDCLWRSLRSRLTSQAMRRRGRAHHAGALCPFGGVTKVVDGQERARVSMPGSKLCSHEIISIVL